LHGHTEDRQRGQGGDHSGKVGSPAGASDDHLNAVVLGCLGERHHSIRGSMGRHNAIDVADAELIER